jgi:tRNA A37 threonylcarbamoyladenosine dehydratase
LIDADIVDETNLPRLLGAGIVDIGKPKTHLAARNARRANPHVQLTIIQTGSKTPPPAVP